MSQPTAKAQVWPIFTLILPLLLRLPPCDSIKNICLRYFECDYTFLNTPPSASVAYFASLNSVTQELRQLCPALFLRNLRGHAGIYKDRETACSSINTVQHLGRSVRKVNAGGALNARNKKIKYLFSDTCESPPAGTFTSQRSCKSSALALETKAEHLCASMCLTAS